MFLHKNAGRKLWLGPPARSPEHLPDEEIGYVLGIAPAAARKRHGRALLRLERLLREDGFPESGS